MKFITSEVAVFMGKRSSHRNLRLLLRFLAILLGVICLYSISFHFMMARENQSFSWMTGFYWTLTVMSTLGFGDITFQSDLGRVFSILVLVTGMVFLLVLFPFTLIEFFYAPWVAAQNRARAPRELPADTSGHVIITNYDPVTTTLIRKLEQYGYPYALLVGELEQALRLVDEGYRVVVGDPDLPDTYTKLRLEKALLVTATGSDVENTNIAFTVRELSRSVSIVSTASSESAAEILKLAGSSHVFQLGELMGRSLARRTIGGDAVTHVIGHFDQLIIAEATVTGTPLVGKTLSESKLRAIAGVNVIGVWDRGEFKVANPDTKITSHTVLVMSGSTEHFRRYDELFCIYHQVEAPVIIIGGGRVGRAIGKALDSRNQDYRIVELIPERVQRFGNNAIIGDAADLEVLEKAGIREAPAVIITSHDDDTNVYLTIFCRKLRPDIQVISRSTRDRNVSTLHRAGADFVMSYASMGANIIFNWLKRNDILMVAEGLNIFRVKVPEALVGKSLAGASLRKETGCHVIAVQSQGQMRINPDPAQPLESGQEIVLISDADAEKKFFERYGVNSG